MAWNRSNFCKICQHLAKFSQFWIFFDEFLPKAGSISMEVDKACVWLRRAHFSSQCGFQFQNLIFLTWMASTNFSEDLAINLILLPKNGWKDHMRESEKKKLFLHKAQCHLYLYTCTFFEIFLILSLLQVWSIWPGFCTIHKIALDLYKWVKC